MKKSSRASQASIMALASVLAAGCATVPTGGPMTMPVVCPTSADVPNARYVGPYGGIENNLTVADMARDLYCGEQFKQQNFPRGFVTVFGSSRIGEQNTLGTPEVNAANDAVYRQIRNFAFEWSRRYGNEYPILSGAGPGLMEAAARGASEAGARSIGYTTYYDPADSSDPARPYGGDAARALRKYDGADIITDGLIFSSVAMRETLMILHSAAIVIGPGGTGTDWETFQLLEEVKSRQLRCVPIYLVGNAGIYWQSFMDRLDDMVRRGTVGAGEVTRHFELVENAEDLVEKLSAAIGKPCSR
jgi:predicted Rossmann-fold nucleotide-binding protein